MLIPNASAASADALRSCVSGALMFGGLYVLTIPPVVLGAVLAALIASFSSWHSNKKSYRQLRMQHDHDAEQKSLERQMALRKEVYLEAASWATDVLSSAGNLPNVTNTSGLDTSRSRGAGGSVTPASNQ
jgi:hypothetical protein